MDRYMDRQEIIELVQNLIRSPSANPPGDTGDCAKIIFDKFTKENIDAEIIEGRKGVCNVVARLPG
jgi:acetylornithine deacetylase/succinyl-diaminopimelate desuccinylase-like protein